VIDLPLATIGCVAGPRHHAPDVTSSAFSHIKSHIMSSTSYPVIDLDLARRLERAECLANAASVESRQQLQPEVNAKWVEIAGAYAMFDGAESPLTQTFGLGLFAPFGEPEFEVAERFFTERGATTAHEVASFAAYDTLAMLSTRGYSPIEASVVLVRPAAIPTETPPAGIVVRPLDASEIGTWSRVAAQGWETEAPGLGEFLENLGAVVGRARGVTCFIAEREGQPIAAGTLNISNGVALLAGATTIPTARRLGAQRALLQARLAFAVERGIDLAMVVTHPGTASHRNAERQGFRPVYTRMKWQRTLPA
jgi:GNAT superfamily N-acetyltransferase